MVRRLAYATTLAVLFAASSQVSGSELAGPGRFCGYSPIIDLIEGERIVTLEGGIHGGTFDWHGSFGTLNVWGIGWAGKPKGKMRHKLTDKGHAIFQPRKEDGKYVIAIWNKANGAAYFRSSSQFTKAQIMAIERVDLFDEAKPDPEG
nr:hypothetical protein [Sphingorhabdus sp.]